jgi:hypothetical protein
MEGRTLGFDDGVDHNRLQAWRICRAWKQILGIKLDVNVIAKQLRNMKHFSEPTPSADKVLAQIEVEKKSQVVVLAEIKEPGGNRARKGGAHDTGGESTVKISIFEN